MSRRMAAGDEPLVPGVSNRSADGPASEAAPPDAPARRRTWLQRGIFGLGVVLSWQAASGRIVDPFWTSSPIEVGGTLFKWMTSGLIFHHLWVTVQETGVGFAVGALSGIVAGVLIGQSATATKVLDPFITAVYGLPKIALAPLFIMWFGIGMMPKVVLAAVSVFFLVFFNTVGGVREIHPEMLDMMRVMGASRFDLQRKIMIPSALPWIFLGLKLGLPYGFVGAVAAEMMASNQGIGFLAQSAAGQFDTAGVFAALLALMAVTTALNELLARLEHRVFRWRE